MPPLQHFLSDHREELLARCRSLRPKFADGHPLPHAGLEMFVDQLIVNLSTGDASTLVAVGRTAGTHGGELRASGYSRSQVVYEYGNVCQAVTQMAIETAQPMTVREFQALNRCVDDAIASAVGGTEAPGPLDAESIYPALMHEIRNHLNTAGLAFALLGKCEALEDVPMKILERSLDGLRQLVEASFLNVRLSSGVQPMVEDIMVAPLVEELAAAGRLAASAQRCEFVSSAVQADLCVRADRRLLHSAVWNLLQNAFKFTRLGTTVSLDAFRRGDVVWIAVTDQCGGLPARSANSLFTVYEQRSNDRSGLGIGLAIARRAVEACGGAFDVQDAPGAGCTFSVKMASCAGASAP
jgi:signal transduction histidine kinase